MAFRWDDGNIAAGSGINYSTLNYGQTYDMEGWTIVPTEDGTRFTSDGTGHGMFVSIENVYSDCLVCVLFETMARRTGDLDRIEQELTSPEMPGVAIADGEADPHRLSREVDAELYGLN